jgi:hypothetical protein
MISVTFVPRSSVRVVDVAEAAMAAGQGLYFKGHVVVQAAGKPGAGWTRVAVARRAGR